MIAQLKYGLKKLIRQGFTFNKLFCELKKSQYFSDAQLEDLQNKKLRKIVEHCYKNVPYYKEIFDSLNLKPKDIKTKDDLKKLPFLDKYGVKENFYKLTAKNKSKLLCNLGQTSGTTGTPLDIYRDYHSINFENAAVHRHYTNVVDFKMRKVTFRGQLVIPIERKSPPFWQHNFADNELVMSSYHLSDKTAETFIEKIKEFNPQIICAYPSSVYLLAKYFDDLNQKMKLKAIFTSSEKLKPEQRDLIEKTFGCKAFDWYGQAERVVAIGQCEKNTYHIIEDYSIVETIETEDGYELVGTNLENYVMPLLRYKTGDKVKFAQNKCDCGRHFRAVETIQGRETSYYIMTEDGIKVTAFDHFARGINNIKESQIIQEKIGELIINITTNSYFNERDQEQLVKNALAHTSCDMKIIVNEVSQIPRGPNGKFVGVINKLVGKSNCEQ